jgi:hypothetical protein
MAVTAKITVVSNAIPSTPVDICRYFEGIFRLHIEGKNVLYPEEGTVTFFRNVG